MKVLIAIVMLLAIAGLWYYNQQLSTANEQAALAAMNRKPFQPVSSQPLRPKPTFTPAPAPVAVATTEERVQAPRPLPAQLPSPQPARFNCDGRIHCSQMHSCEEATFFIQHCPNTQMDGDNDGTPCERQWC